MRTSPEDVRQQSFSVKLRGFDVEEVGDYLELIAEELMELNNENSHFKEQIDKIQGELDPLKKSETDYRKLIDSAQVQRKDILSKAKKDAEMMLRNAQIKGREIIKNTEEKIIQLEKRIRELKLQKEQFEISLRSLIENHLKMLDVTREMDRKDG